MSSIAGKKILLGVSGSIAIAKSLDLVSRLKKAGASLRVVMTPSAKEMVAPVTYATLTEHPVYHSMWGTDTSHTMEHLSWSKWGELLLVAPASANTIAALAHGFAENPLTSTALAFRGPVVLCPAMNPAMFSAVATQANIETLRARGVRFCGPIVGLTACRDEGLGRMAEVDEIMAFVEGIFAEGGGGPSVESVPLVSAERRSVEPRGDGARVAEAAASPLAGKRVLITAGPTREPIDAVRFLSNASTGKMGIALAREAARRGAWVDLILGPTGAVPPDDPRIEVHHVGTAYEMHDAAMARVREAQVCIFSAAVADFRPEKASKQKVKKGEMGEAALRLVRNPDIAAEVGKLDLPGQVRVGFAAETHDLDRFAREKLERKNLHLIVGNDVSQPGIGFASDENAVAIFARGEAEPTHHATESKDAIAGKILDRVEAAMAKLAAAADV